MRGISYVVNRSICFSSGFPLFAISMKPTPLEPIARANLIVLARAYAAATEVKLSTVSRISHGEPSFFDVLIENKPRRKGGSLPSCTFRKYDQVIEWFEAHWPEGVAKPEIWEPPSLDRKRRLRR